jgi:ABC-type branched-subunit amino acid transport system ATPase component
MSNTLRAIGISKRFGGVQALSDVTLAVSEGTILGLIGPNGSGKTTLVNIITGVLRADAGQVFVGDIDATGWRPDDICRLGVGRTFQMARLFGSLTVRENVEVGVMARPEANVDDRVTHLLDRFNLTQWTRTRVSDLPFGVERRLGIALALSVQPRFLLLDEPAAGLNDEESDQLLGMIRGIQKDPEFRCGILIIDHDLRLIFRLCDSVHVLTEGKTLAEATPEEIRHNQAVIESYLGRDYE